MDQILLFGGSFDPIHHGHLIVGRHVAEQLNVAQVVLIPGASPPHKGSRRLAPVADRLAMCRLATTGDPQFAVSAWETEQEGPNYTIHTISHFRETRGPQPAPSEAEGTGLYWLVGMDGLRELGSWHRASELVDACTVVTAARPGFSHPDWSALGGCFSARQIEKLEQHIIEGPRIDIAGTDIRARVRTGRSIRYLVPEPVRRYIVERGLYREA